MEYRSIPEKQNAFQCSKRRREIEEAAIEFYKQLKERSYVTKPKTKKTTDGSGDS